MIRLTLSFIIFLSSFLFSYSQPSVEEELRNALKKKPRLEFRLDSRNTFISQDGVRVFGLKLGLSFDNKLTFGLGYNELLSKVKREATYGGEMHDVRLGYSYISPYVDFIFYRDDRWELSIPVQIGLGETYYAALIDEKDITFARGFVLSYEPAITFQYKFLSYFGAGAGVGYRLMVIRNPAIKEDFTSPVYLFKFKIYFQDIYQDIFH